MNLPPLPAPDSYLFQHDETGQTMFVDSQQVEWGFEKNNPRLHKIGGAFTEKQLQEYARQAQREAVAAAVPKRSTGWTAPRDRYAVPVLFSPYTGEPRDVRDVQSDPQGILIQPPGNVTMIAAAPGGER